MRERGTVRGKYKEKENEVRIKIERINRNKGKMNVGGRG